MHFTSPRQWIDALWLLFGAYWLASALKRKKTKQRETILQRFAYTLPLGLGFYFLYEPHPPYGWLSAPFLPARPVGAWLGVALTASGIAVAFWARWHLGRDWSCVVSPQLSLEPSHGRHVHAIRHPIST